MKKLLFFLLLPFVAAAQFNADKLCDFTIDGARTYADEIVSLSKDKFRFYKIEDDRESVKFIYVPSSLSDKNLTGPHDYMDYETVEVLYDVYMAGKNDDLKNPGVKTYRLSRAHGQFLNIFPFWQKYYVPEATIENYKDYRMRELKKGQMLIKFQDLENGNWYIDNIFCAKGS